MSVATAAKAAKKAATPGPWRCQFCAQGLHRSCPRATRHNGKIWLCGCGAGADDHHPMYCLDCKNTAPDDIDGRDWSCFDKHGCAARQQARNEANPIWRMVHAAKVHSAVINKAKRLNEERLLAGIDPFQDEAIERLNEILDQLANKPAAKVRKPPKPPKPRTGKCECCGDPTKGGRFIPGHDAKLASRLKAEVVSGSDEAYAEMKARGWIKKLPAKLIRAEDR